MGVRVSSSSLVICFIFDLFAAIAQLVERDLAKVEVAGPSPVCRSLFYNPQPSVPHSIVAGGSLSVTLRVEAEFAAMVELVDTRDLKSLGQKWLCGFESRSRHTPNEKCA